MLKFLFFIFFISTTLSAPTDQELLTLFNSYVTEHKRSYSSAESTTRFQIFKQNYLLIEESNSKHQGFSLKIGPNFDKSTEDYKVLTSLSNLPQFTKLDEAPTPETIDWVKLKKVSKSKAFNSCEAPWAFAAIDTIESMISISKSIPAFEISVQQVISCSDFYGNLGCSSGTLNNTYTFAQNSVLCTEIQYPYVGKASSCKRKFFCQNRITEFSLLQSKNETQLKLAVAQQPVAVTLNATKELLAYSGGILSVAGCGSGIGQTNLVVVGYGSVAGRDVWVVRGYWGQGWGIGGYGMLERNDANDKTAGACGIALEAYIPRLMY